MQAINLQDAFEQISEYWRPQIAAEANGQHVRITKLHGEFVWHQHAEEDEVFIVLKGEMTVRFRDHEETVRSGELLVIPRGVEHLPVANEEVWLINITKAGTTTTGDAISDRATPLSELKRLS